MRTWIGIVICLAACSRGDAPRRAPAAAALAKVSAPVDAALVTRIEVPPEMPVPDLGSAPVALPVLVHPARNAYAVNDAAVQTVGLQGCDVATSVELHDTFSTPDARCSLALRAPDGVTYVDTLAICEDSNGKGGEVRRTTLVSASCSGIDLVAELEARDGNQVTQLHVVCSMAIPPRIECKRNADADLVDAGARAAAAAIAKHVERHEWSAVLAMSDRAQHATQQKLGVGTMQYLAENLGLGFEDNAATLAEIRSVELAEISPSHGGYAVIGLATLANGKRVRLGIQLVRDGATFRITGAVG